MVKKKYHIFGPFTQDKCLKHANIENIDINVFSSSVTLRPIGFNFQNSTVSFLSLRLRNTDLYFEICICDRKGSETKCLITLNERFAIKRDYLDNLCTDMHLCPYIDGLVLVITLNMLKSISHTRRTGHVSPWSTALNAAIQVRSVSLRLERFINHSGYYYCLCFIQF